MAAKKQVKVGLGGDPEVFVTQDGKVVPVCGRIGGTKRHPIQFSSDPAFKKPYTWLEDNVALEFNFDPVYSIDTFKPFIQGMLVDASHYLRAKGLSMKIEPSMKFNQRDLNLHQQALEIGCDPDFCAHEFNGVEHLPRTCPTADTLGNMRFAAGHMHVSYDVEEVPAHAGALFFDAMVVLPTLQYDKQGERRKFYGKAGLYRPKPYGFEHRTMSNWWLRNSHAEKLQGLAGQILRLYSMLGKSPNAAATWFASIPHEDVKSVIDAENIKDANTLYQEICVKMPPAVYFPRTL